MFAQVMIYEGESAEDTAAGMEHVLERVSVALQKSPILNGLWLVDRENGRRMTIMAWDSEADRDAGMQAIAAELEANPAKPHPNPTAVQQFEIYARI